VSPCHCPGLLAGHLLYRDEPLEFAGWAALERVVPDLYQPTFTYHDTGALGTEDDPACELRTGGFVPDNKHRCRLFAPANFTTDIIDSTTRRERVPDRDPVLPPPATPL